VWIYTGNKSAKFHENRLSLSENIVKSFRGYFLTHTVLQQKRRGQQREKGRGRKRGRGGEGIEGK